MTTNSPSANARGDDVSDDSEQASTARSVGSTLATLDWTWVASAMAGGALLVRGLRTVRERRARGLLQIAVGGALLAVGYTRRGSTDVSRAERDAEASADAHAELERPDVDENPRDVSTQADRGPVDEDEGTIRFTDDQDADLESAPAPEGGESTAGDGEDAGDTVEVDISEAAMADEPGEAAGPSPEQAHPTTTKTDGSPPTDAETPDVEDGVDADGSDGDGETVETGGGTEVHTDAMESGTIDVDEDDVTDESGAQIDDPEEIESPSGDDPPKNPSDDEELADDGVDEGSTGEDGEDAT